MSNYASLKAVFDKAYRQASEGKGKDRHADDKPFEEQTDCAIGRHQGIGFPLGQAEKKIIESRMLGKEDAIRELLGAMKDTAMAVILLEEELLAGKKRVCENFDKYLRDNAINPVEACEQNTFGDKNEQKRKNKKSAEIHCEKPSYP